MQANNTIPGGDVQAMIDKKKHEEALLLSEAERITREAQLLQKNVYKNANPHPLMITCVVLMVIFMIWLLYVMFVKPVATGEWLNTQNNHVWYIRHNQLTNTLRITIIDNKGKILLKSARGRIRGSIIKVHDIIGIWDFNNMIVFVGDNGGGLQRVN